jgi:hypothetical protein
MAKIRSVQSRPLVEWGRWLLGLVLLAGLAWLPHSPALYFVMCAGTPVTAQEADLDHNGRVTFMETAFACNVDSRPVAHRGQNCTEYFSRADWRQIKLVCE